MNRDTENELWFDCSICVCVAVFSSIHIVIVIRSYIDSIPNVLFFIYLQANSRILNKFSAVQCLWLKGFDRFDWFIIYEHCLPFTDVVKPYRSLSGQITFSHRPNTVFVRAIWLTKWIALFSSLLYWLQWSLLHEPSHWNAYSMAKRYGYRNQFEIIIINNNIDDFTVDIDLIRSSWLIDCCSATAVMNAVRKHARIIWANVWPAMKWHHRQCVCRMVTR